MATNNGSSINNGGQQVSIYPFQELKSVLGNEIIHGLYDEGVFNATINITDGGANVNFNIGVGTTLVFKRTFSGQTFIGKTVLGGTGVLSVPKTQLWTNTVNTNYYNSNKLYVVADWSYDIADPTTKYVLFTLEYDNGTPLTGPSIGSVLAYNGTTNHKLIVATILNNQAAKALYPGDPSGWLPGSSSSGQLRIAYDNQINRNVIKRDEARNNSFTVDFSGTGTNLYVSLGKTFVSGSLNFLSNTVNTIAPAGQATNYLVSKTTGVTATTASLVNPNQWIQIDALRLKKQENVAAAASLLWESFVFPLSMVSPYVAGWPNLPVNYNDILTLLKTTELPLVGDGKTILICVRNFAAISPTSVIWPENCIIFNEQLYIDGSNATQSDVVLVQDTAKYHDRFKIPVWTSSDLGY